MSDSKGAELKAHLQYVCAVSCELCPDVTEWCPVAGFEDILAYGTYELDEASGQRRGCLHIARLVGSDCKAALSLESELNMPGVYDVAWAPPGVQQLTSSVGSSGPLILAVAGADGALRLVHVGGCERRCEVELATAPCILLEDGILTHVAWGASGSNGLAAVGQDGVAHHVVIREDGSLVELARRAAHELEAWCVDVSQMDAGPAGAHLVLTGADDSCLLGWDLREAPDAAPAFINRRSHAAGVTAVACSPHQEWCLATGSYDEKLRIFDLRAAARTPLSESEQLGDGAYHVAWHPSWQSTLAVAAMRSGLPLLQVAVESGSSEMIEWARYAADAPEGAHGSLAYGVSWQVVPALEGVWHAASASFYDRSIHIWSVTARDAADAEKVCEEGLCEEDV